VREQKVVTTVLVVREGAQYLGRRLSKEILYSDRYETIEQRRSTERHELAEVRVKGRWLHVEHLSAFRGRATYASYTSTNNMLGD
jgi:hypothetical protein